MTKKKRTYSTALSSSKAGKMFCTLEYSSAAKNRSFPSDCPYSDCRMESVELVQLAKQEWESTVDLMPQIFCLVDESGHIFRANRTIERWGLGKVTEVSGKRMHDLLHPDCHESLCSLRNFWDIIPEIMRENGAVEYRIEDSFLHRHLHLSFQSQQTIQDESTKIRNYFGVAVVGDISDIKNAENQLKKFSSELELLVKSRTLELTNANLRLQQEIEDRERIQAELEKSRIEFRLLVETMSEGLMVYDNKGMVTYINDRFCEMLKRSREEIIGHAAIEFIDETSHATWNLQIANLKAGKVTSDEIKLKGLKGHGIWAKVSPSPLPDQHGGPVGNFAVFTDIDEHILAEYALRVSKNQLRKLSEQVMSAQEKERQRVSSELHDGIGQTLSAVKFCVEAGIKSICEQPTEESFRHLESVIPKIQHAIEEVRRISMALRPSILDDIGVLATLTWFCRESSLVYKNISIQLQLDIKEENIPVRIKVVIFRIVQEAFNNAVKHSSANRINIILKLVGETIVLSIEDNGVGFDSKCVGSNGSIALSGLGLASMRERAELASGICSIDSTKGAGTKIKVAWRIEKN